jgi:hypothetical protein
VLVPELVTVLPVDKAPEYDSPKRTNLDVADRLTVMVLVVLDPIEDGTHHSSTLAKVPLLNARDCDAE